MAGDGDGVSLNDKVGGKKKDGKLGKYKWWIVGALAVIAIVVFVIINRQQASGGSTSGQQAAAGIDPSTGIPYSSEYAGLSASGIPGPQGATGPRGPAGPSGKPPKKKKKVTDKKPTAIGRMSNNVHPVTRMQGAATGLRQYNQQVIPLASRR